MPVDAQSPLNASEPFGEESGTDRHATQLSHNRFSHHDPNGRSAPGQ
jgi:hypothetical protein